MLRFVCSLSCIPVTTLPETLLGLQICTVLGGCEMRKGNWRLALVVMAAVVAVCAFGMLVSAIGECYEDVIVSGAGWTSCNDTYTFFDMYNDHPHWEDTRGHGIYWEAGTWRLGILYTNPADTPAPPSTGWLAIDPANNPAPTLSGGEACSGGDGGDGSTSIAAAVTVAADPDGFLDVVLEVDEPIMAGELELAAIHAVGDVVTGGSSTAFHLYIYSVDITARPETIVLIAHRMASFNRETREYEFSWDTSGLAPGYYDVRLSFGATAHNFRIQLTAE